MRLVALTAVRGMNGGQSLCSQDSTPADDPILFFKRNRTSRRKLWGSTAILACLVTGTACADDWPIGTMTDLGTLGGVNSSALAINADGSVIVGVAYNASSQGHAVSWTDGATTPTDLGTLGGTYGVANAVNADGTVIVGWSFNAAGRIHAVSWADGATTPTDLGTLTGGSDSNASAVSAGGSVIVGWSYTASGYQHAVSWADRTTTATDLGTLTGGYYSSASAVSADGSIIVGWSYNAAGRPHAVSWADGATTPTDLGTLGGSDSVANAVSADGSVIVGTAYNPSYQNHAVSWVNGATTPTDLGTLGGIASIPMAVSADGSVIVGSAYNAADQQHAVSWTNGATTPTDLGTLGGDLSEANAVSADGSVIVGYATTAANQGRAVSWVDGAVTPTDLGTLGGNFSVATAVSADGSVIVGQSNTSSGLTHAFVLRTRAAAPMQDLNNIYLSMPILADNTAIVFARQVGVLTDLLNGECRITPGASWCLSTTLSGFAVSGQQSALTGRVSLGYAVDEQITTGLALAVTTKDRIGDGAFDIATMPSFGLWGTYSAGGTAGTGLQADIAAAYGKTRADITRGLGLDNVIAVAGNADLATLAGRAGVGYGFVGKGWLVTPSLSLETYRMSRSAYDEDASADFPAQYNRLTTNLTTATLSLAGEHPIGDRQRIGLNTGIVADVDYTKAGLGGTSTIPGMGKVSQNETLHRNTIRPFIEASYSFNVGDRSTLSVGAGLSRAAYGDDPALSVQIGYGTAF